MENKLELVGLFYGGLTIIGVSIGALVGFFAGGGAAKFVAAGGWINTVVGVCIGGVLGVGLGLICHGVLMLLGKS